VVFTSLPLWVWIASTGVGGLFVIGIVHALAVRVAMDREIHNLRVTATRMRIAQIKRVRAQLRENADRAATEEQDLNDPTPPLADSTPIMVGQNAPTAQPAPAPMKQAA